MGRFSAVMGDPRRGRPLSSGVGLPAGSGGGQGRYPGTLPAAGFFCASLGAHRAAELLLSEIKKPGSGCTADFTSDGQEPLNREHLTCSW